MLLWFRGASGTCGPFTCPPTERGSCSCSSRKTSSPCRGPRPSCSKSFRTRPCCLRWAFSPGLGAWLVAGNAAYWPLPGHVQVLCKTPVTQGGKGFGRVGPEGWQLLLGPRGLSWTGLPGWARRRNQTPRGWKVLWPRGGELREQGWDSVEGAGRAGGGEAGRRERPGPLERLAPRHREEAVRTGWAPVPRRSISPTG